MHVAHHLSSFSWNKLDTMKLSKAIHAIDPILKHVQGLVQSLAYHSLRVRISLHASAVCSMARISVNTFHSLRRHFVQESSPTITYRHNAKFRNAILQQLSARKSPSRHAPQLEQREQVPEIGLKIYDCRGRSAGQLRLSLDLG